MPSSKKINVFWFRRDLRLHDNAGLYHALRSGQEVLPIFIFDTNILDKLSDRSDKRLLFIHQSLQKINEQLRSYDSSLKTFHGDPLSIFKKIIKEYSIGCVYSNEDYEPYAIERDRQIEQLLAKSNIDHKSFKDQVIFAKNEILKADGKPYTIYTPYKNRWRENLNKDLLRSFSSEKSLDNLFKSKGQKFHSLKELGFNKIDFEFPSNQTEKKIIQNYHETRDLPGIAGTSKLGIHLRFGTISIRRLSSYALKTNDTFANELIWREFFMMILYHFPYVLDSSFKKKYNRIPWRNDEKEFKSWCEGKTGYAFVDAGMRELNTTGFMHNRVRMICASFLTKHLLIDWRLGEAYFAEKLLDFELSSNNGNWQWASGGGCDASPYFRVFNPITQADKFDRDKKYIRKWVPEFETTAYKESMIVDHKMARIRCLATFKKALADS